MTDEPQPLKGKLEKIEMKIAIPTSLMSESDLKEHIPKGTFWYEDVASAVKWLKEVVSETYWGGDQGKEFHGQVFSRIFNLIDEAFTDVIEE